MKKTNWHLIPAFLALPLVVLVFCPPLAAQKTGELVKDELHGISFKVPKDWVSIPVDPTETLVIHKYQADRPDMARKIRFSETARLEVMFFPAQKAVTEEEIEGIKNAESGVDRIKAAQKLLNKDYDSYIENRFKTFEQTKPVRKKIKGIPATYLDMVGAFRKINGEPIDTHIKSCVFQTDDGEFVFQFSCLDEHFKKRHKSDMDASIRTFKRIDKKVRSEIDEFSQHNANERYIEEQKAKLPSGWYSFLSKNGNYWIFSNADKQFAKEIEKNLEGIHECLVKLFPGEPRIDWIPIVRVCKTKDEYHGYGGPAGSAGYWSDMTKEFVFYNDIARGKRNTFKTLKHEAFHHYIHFLLGCPPSTWFDEGHADYVAGGEFAGKRIKIKQNLWRRGTIQSAIVNGSFVPIKKLVYMTKAQYYAQPGLCYAEGWSFVYFLLEGKKNGGKMKKGWDTIPSRYLGHFRDAFAALEEKERAKPDDEERRLSGPFEVNYKLSEEAKQIALERTFEGWTDKDWQDLEDAWADFTR